MEKFNHSLLELEFKYGYLNGTYMSMEIDTGAELIKCFPNDQHECLVVVPVVFPGKITLNISGKDMGNDTIIDENGKIVADKFIQLTNARIDRVEIKNIFLSNWPVINGEINSTYFGFNGNVELAFDESNSFQWLLKIQ